MMSKELHEDEEGYKKSAALKIHRSTVASIILKCKSSTQAEPQQELVAWQN